MDRSVLSVIYEKVKTPYKYGIVWQLDRFLCDSPVVFRHEGQWWMSYVAIDAGTKGGYQTRLAVSPDLLHFLDRGALPWKDHGWDRSQCGGYAQFQDPVFGGTNELRPIGGYYRFAYIGGALTGYETDPLFMGYGRTPTLTDLSAYTRDPYPILSPTDKDARPGETLTVYKADMFEDPKRTLGYPYVCAYNAKNGTHRESIFLAVSRDGEKWIRYGDRAILSVFDEPENICILGDPQIVLIDGVYVMFYFVYDKPAGVAYNTFAASEDLVHFTKWQGGPLVRSEYPWEDVYAHKQWIISYEGVVYHFYCAVDRAGHRSIALATSKPLGKTADSKEKT